MLYEDRFLGLMECRVDVFLNSHDIPFHRVQMFKENGQVCWDRKNKFTTLWFHRCLIYFWLKTLLFNISASLSISSWQDNVVDGNENKFDEVADEAHHYETHTTRIQDLEVLLLVRLLALRPEVLRVSWELLDRGSHRLFLLDGARHFYISWLN